MTTDNNVRLSKGRSLISRRNLLYSGGRDGCSYLSVGEGTDNHIKEEGGCGIASWVMGEDRKADKNSIVTLLIVIFLSTRSNTILHILLFLY